MLSLSLQLDDEKEKAALAKAEEESEDVDALMDPAILEAFIAQRMQEMMKETMQSRYSSLPRVCRR